MGIRFELMPADEETSAVVLWVHLDDANSFFNFRLRQHYTDDEIAENPARIWRA